MEDIMIGIVLLFYFIYIIIKVKECGETPGYDEWLTEDKAKYPELYDE
jgi:hypothetical protein